MVKTCNAVFQNAEIKTSIEKFKKKKQNKTLKEHFDLQEKQNWKQNTSTKSNPGINVHLISVIMLNYGGGVHLDSIKKNSEELQKYPAQCKFLKDFKCQ